MKKYQVAVATLLATSLSVSAQQRAGAHNDSIRVVNLQEVEVVSTRATATTPVAFTTLSKEQIKKQNFGQDIPYLLSMTPSAITTSDAGTGVGYTTLRVRGTDGTRINITANGIPMNDAESHSLFWVNLPDFASSVKDIQVQRGAGTSTNGAGSFGASVNMQTEGIAMTPYTEINGAYGSFNVHKETVKFGTGLLNGRWAFDARLSNIGTDGYIDRASVDLYSYYLQGGYFANRTSVKFITFAGKEKTYHAWNYASKEEMEKNGRRYNSCGLMYEDANGEKQYYDDQTDNYLQANYQLLLNHTFSPFWNLNAALHYTKGDGYYQEYKPKASPKRYALVPYHDQGTEVNATDLVRQKKMNNHFGGGVFALNYTSTRLQASIGGGVNQYKGHHYGRVIWVKNYIGTLNPDHEYYRNHSRKTDGNLYLKANYQLTTSLSAYADLQYRLIRHRIDGPNDKWNDATNAPQQLDIDQTFGFFNPKAGLNWQINSQNRLYGSFSIAQKEPTRNNYTDGRLTQHPQSEHLTDYELGYTYANTWLTAGANLYYMNYRDQLVLTGELNEIGEPMANNVPHSYRMGIELMLGMKPWNGFHWDINATLSRNRVKHFTETLYQGWEGINPIEIAHGSTPIAFSPDWILNNRFAYSYRGFEAALQSQYVSKQYLSNARQEDQTLDAYFVSNLNLAYTFHLPKVKSITVGCTLYNLFNAQYENNGYASSYYLPDANGNPSRHNDSGYAAQAGTNLMINLSLRF